jgi:hypothetical protein
MNINNTQSKNSNFQVSVQQKQAEWFSLKKANAIV